MTRALFVGWSLLAVLFFAAAAFMSAAGLPGPRGDDAFYKAPGVELVQSGRFASPSVTGYLPRIEEIFAAYPPLYAFAFAGWTKVFGFSLVATTAFNHALHLVGVASMTWFTARLLRGIDVPAGIKFCLLASVAVVHFGNLRFFDRQEEMALCFIWLEGLFWLRRQETRSATSGIDFVTMAVSGSLVGLAAAVGPWPGLLAAAVVAFRTVFKLQSFAEAPAAFGWLAGVAVLSALPLGLAIAWVEMHYPGLTLLQFREHVGRVPHVSAFAQPGVWASSWTYAPYQLPFLFVGLLLAPRALGGPRSAAGAAVGALTLVAIMGIAVGAVWRADSYVYLWMGLFLLHPVVVFWIAKLIAKTPSPAERRILIAFAVVAATVSVRDPLSLCVQAGQYPLADKPDAVFARLHELIPPNDLVATTPRFWHAFQGRNPWRQTAILPSLKEEDRLAWQWIVLPYGHGGGDYRERLLAGFELAEERPIGFEPFAPTFQKSEIGWGYEAYRRKRPKID